MWLAWHLKMKNAIILKMGREGWSELRTGSVPELKEEKRIVGEISWGPDGHRETRMGKEKDVVGEKDPYFTLFIFSSSWTCYMHSQTKRV